MSHATLLILAPLVACVACQSAPANQRSDSIEVSAVDVHHFVDALHRLDPADSTCAPIADYLRQESRGLAAYRRKFDVDQRGLCLAVRRSPARYADLEAKLPALDSVADQVKSLFAKFASLHTPKRLPAVYFVVGNGISAGSTAGGGQPMILVGMELNRSLDNLAGVMAHELIHTQQQFPFFGSMTGGPSFLRGSLLRHSITEGSANFLAELITGTHVRNTFAESHERELWVAFQREANGTNYRRWLYNGRDSIARGPWPPDLGYWIGYRISQSYYENAQDKQQAIADLLSIRDFPRFLAASKYDGNGARNNP